MRGHVVAEGTAVLALCAWCGWASGFHRTTTGAQITWLVTTGAVATFDVALWRRARVGRAGRCLQQARPSQAPRPGRGDTAQALRAVAPWLGFIMVIVAWEVLGIDTGPHQYHLTISALAQAYRPLNAALLLVWVLVGVGYEAARLRRPLDGPDGLRPADPPGARGGAVRAITVGSTGAHQRTLGLLLPQSPSVGVAFWVAVPIVAVLIDTAGRHSAGRRATAEEFVRFISTAWPANLALIAAWGFAGYHLFAR